MRTDMDINFGKEPNYSAFVGMIVVAAVFVVIGFVSVDAFWQAPPPAIKQTIVAIALVAILASAFKFLGFWLTIGAIGTAIFIFAVAGMFGFHHIV